DGVDDECGEGEAPVEGVPEHEPADRPPGNGAEPPTDGDEQELFHALQHSAAGGRGRMRLPPPSPSPRHCVRGADTMQNQINRVLLGQYEAAISMLRDAIASCPPAQWDAN